MEGNEKGGAVFCRLSILPLYLRDCGSRGDVSSAFSGGPYLKDRARPEVEEALLCRVLLPSLDALYSQSYHQKKNGIQNCVHITHIQ